MRVLIYVRLVVFVMFMFLSIGLVSACGGFFCTTAPIDQNAERIIFTVNGDGTLTAIVGITYVGDAEDFSWVVPVPSPPELDVAETQSITTLQLSTDVSFVEPRNYCRGLFSYMGRGGGGGGDPVIEMGNVGPYDYVILGSDDPDELVNWLRDNGYQVTDSMIPIIDVYVEDGMYFLAMKLSQDSEVGDIQPVVMTYESTNPMIPIRLTAVAAVEDMPVITWIFGESQYVPENFAHPEPDFSTFKNSNQVRAIGHFGGILDYVITDDGFFLTGDQVRYQNRLEDIQEEYDGLAFVTEYAGPTSGLPESLRRDELLDRLFEEFPYMTRLRAQMSPEQMTLDPVFVPDPDAADVSNVIELVNYVDPIIYWGCTSESAITDATREHLPAGRTYIDDLRIQMAHPEDWILSEIPLPDGDTAYAIAPEEVTFELLEDFILQGTTFPVLLVSKVSPLVDEYRTETLSESLGYRSNLPLSFPSGNYSGVRYYPYQYEREAEGVAYALLTSREDWRQSEEMYDAMLDYSRSFEYYMGSELPHTIFLSAVQSMNAGALHMGYPNGWNVDVADDGSVIFSPDEVDDNSVYIRISDVQQIYESDEIYQAFMQRIGSQQEELYDGEPIIFEEGDVYSFLKFAGPVLIEVVADNESYMDYEDEVQQIIESMSFEGLY